MNERHTVIILVAIAIGVLAAGITGWYWGEEAARLAWIGELFMDTLRMLIVPLVVSAVIGGITELGDVRKLGRMGGATIAYYLTTTFVAACLGLGLVAIFEPGAGVDASSFSARGTAPAEEVGFADMLLSLVSPNIVAAAAETDLLPLILFSLLFGCALTTLGDAGKPVIAFFDGVGQAMMRMVGWVMYLAPIGIFGLVAARLGKAGGAEAFLTEIRAVGVFVGVVVLGLATHGVLLGLTARWVAGKPWSYAAQMGKPLMTAFGTASSSATLPVTLEATERGGVSQRARQFVLPLGSTVNMDGTALYEAIAALFIAQAHGIDLSLSQQVLVVLTAALSAIGAAGIPEAGLVTMVIVLSAVGLPLEGIGMLLAVDWFLDRFRTAVNVFGDAVGAAVVDRLGVAPQAGVDNATAPGAATAPR